MIITSTTYITLFVEEDYSSYRLNERKGGVDLMGQIFPSPTSAPVEVKLWSFEDPHGKREHYRGLGEQKTRHGKVISFKYGPLDRFELKSVHEFYERDPENMRVLLDESHQVNGLYGVVRPTVKEDGKILFGAICLSEMDYKNYQKIYGKD